MLNILNSNFLQIKRFFIKAYVFQKYLWIYLSYKRIINLSQKSQISIILYFIVLVFSQLQAGTTRKTKRPEKENNNNFEHKMTLLEKG